MPVISIIEDLGSTMILVAKEFNNIAYSLLKCIHIKTSKPLKRKFQSKFIFLL